MSAWRHGVVAISLGLPLIDWVAHQAGADAGSQPVSRLRHGQWCKFKEQCAGYALPVGPDVGAEVAVQRHAPDRGRVPRGLGAGVNPASLTNHVQVRLMLVLAPAACCLAGVALHEVLAALFRGVHSGGADADAAAKGTAIKEEAPVASGRAQHKKAPKAKVCVRRLGDNPEPCGVADCAPGCRSTLLVGEWQGWQGWLARGSFKTRLFGPCVGRQQLTALSAGSYHLSLPTALVCVASQRAVAAHTGFLRCSLALAGMADSPLYV